MVVVVRNVLGSKNEIEVFGSELGLGRFGWLDRGNDGSMRERGARVGRGG
jgi:hypothetical protein